MHIPFYGAKQATHLALDKIWAEDQGNHYQFSGAQNFTCIIMNLGYTFMKSEQREEVPWQIFKSKA
jgi:hypothetical protein